MGTPTPLPDELLRDTFARMAARYTAWPRTYEEVMADPMRGRLVRLTATRRAMAARRPAAAPCAAPGRRAAPNPLPTHAPAPFDHKRAAAGDRDD